MSHPVWYTIRTMSIEEKITVRAMERALKAKTQDEVSKAAIWANDQLSWVSLWQRTGVKPKELEF